MKTLISFLAILVLSTATPAEVPLNKQVPKIKLEYSYALDMYCPPAVSPENLTAAQIKLIAKIPTYRNELLEKLPWFQSEWDKQGVHLLAAAMSVIGKPFPIQDLQAALFLCPRFPFMGTPLAFNVISYLDSSAADIPALRGNPSPVFFFVSTAFHEVLHKYINGILEQQPSAILNLMDETDLFEAHLHLFALQKHVFSKLGLVHLLSQIEVLESTHGPDYSRAWKKVYDDPILYEALLSELKKIPTAIN